MIFPIPKWFQMMFPSYSKHPSCRKRVLNNFKNVLKCSQKCPKIKKRPIYAYANIINIQPIVMNNKIKIIQKSKFACIERHRNLNWNFKYTHFFSSTKQKAPPFFTLSPAIDGNVDGRKGRIFFDLRDVICKMRTWSACGIFRNCQNLIFECLTGMRPVFVISKKK